MSRQDNHCEGCQPSGLFGQDMLLEKHTVCSIVSQSACSDQGFQSWVLEDFLVTQMEKFHWNCLLILWVLVFLQPGNDTQLLTIFIWNTELLSTTTTTTTTTTIIIIIGLSVPKKGKAIFFWRTLLRVCPQDHLCILQLMLAAVYVCVCAHFISYWKHFQPDRSLSPESSKLQHIAPNSDGSYFCSSQLQDRLTKKKF